jgi:hypothetical protein
MKIRVVLHGFGRKMNKNEELIGNFYNGELNGKGKYEIKDL